MSGRCSPSRYLPPFFGHSTLRRGGGERGFICSFAAGEVAPGHGRGLFIREATSFRVCFRGDCAFLFPFSTSIFANTLHLHPLHRYSISKEMIKEFRCMLLEGLTGKDMIGSRKWSDPTDQQRLWLICQHRQRT